MPSLSSIPVAILAAVIAIVCTGCAASTASGWELPSVPDDVPRFAGEDPLPFDSYMLSQGELERMQSEHAAMLSGCLAEHGLELSFGGDYIRPPDDSFSSWGGRPGTMSLAHAAEYGYHPEPGGVWAPVGGFYLGDASNVQPASSDDAELLAVLYGVSEPGVESTTGGGCFGEVELAIGGPLVSTIDINVELINLTLTHPQVEKAAAAWSDCMKTSGFEFDSVQLASESFTMAGLSEREISVAIAEVNCTESSRWADIFYFVLADYQEQAITRQANIFAESLSSQKQRLQLLDTLSAAPTS